jgi:hypothetical protein
MAVKKRTRRVPKRKNTPFLKQGIEEINNDIKKAYVKVTGEDKLWQTYEKITIPDAEECFRQYRGKCLYCDTRLSYLGRMSKNSARLMFYVPLKVGGEARPDNLIIVCADCKHEYRDTRKLRQDIVGLDSFADCCEQLFIAVLDGHSQLKIDTLKARINTRLSDVATCMRYVTTPDWKPRETVKLIEGKNTIADRLERMGEGNKVTECITEDVKQIVTTKQYKIIRRPTDE